MKTYIKLLAALAVIASASADSNAICKGHIGDHGIEEGGSNFISCIQKEDGEIVAEIQTCPDTFTWCTHTNCCTPPGECPNPSGGNTIIKIVNIIKTNTNCDGDCDSSSPEDDDDEPDCKCDEGKHPAQHPERCDWWCCVNDESRLFGSAFRGQVQTEDCKPCPANHFWCKCKKRCVPTDTCDKDCERERDERCKCHWTRHPDCSKYWQKCDGSEQTKEKNCPAGYLFLEGNRADPCVGPHDPLFWKAEGFCTCKDFPGHFPKPDGCNGFVCCRFKDTKDQVHAIFGAETNTDDLVCTERQSCGTDEIFCGNKCIHKSKHAECEGYDQRCCSTEPHCFGYTKRCFHHDHEPPMTPCNHGQYWCKNRGPIDPVTGKHEGECGNDDHTGVCEAECNCKDYPEWWENEHDICCIKEDDHKEYTDLYESVFIPKTTVEIEKCGTRKTVCEDCAKWGLVTCGDKTCAASLAECKKVGFENQLDPDMLCSECEDAGVPHDQTCCTPLWTKDSKHKCNFSGTCKYDKSLMKWVYENGSAVQCHQGAGGNNPCKVCTLAEMRKYNLDTKQGSCCFREKVTDPLGPHLECCKNGIF